MQMVVTVRFFVLLMVIFRACVAASVGIGELEGSCQDGAQVRETEKHQRDSDQSVQHGDQLSLRRLRSKVPVACKNKTDEAYLYFLIFIETR